ncbi:MAG: hypothetical protein JNK79_02265 [Chitinophagaceae bacterium]|nr:hypothetical protein [Chitinophagaceae bacterium]
MTTFFAILFTMAVVISASLLVILIANQHWPANSKKILSTFKDAVSEFGLSIAKKELVGKSVIGLDRGNNQLLFFTSSNNKHEGYFIDLAKVKSYEVKKEYAIPFDDDYSRKKVAESEVGRITLNLSYKNGAKSLDLPFYDRNEDSPSELEVREHQAKEWRNLLSSLSPVSPKLKEVRKMPAFRTYINVA